MGIISPFMGGVGDALKFVGMEKFRSNLAAERDEANFMRSRTLKGDDQTFATSEREAGQGFQSAEKQKDRDSALSVAQAKAAGKGEDTAAIKLAEYLKAQVDADGKRKYSDESIDGVISRAFNQIKDESTGDMVSVNSLINKATGSLTNAGGTGPKTWLPEGEDPENAPVTKEDRNAAKKAASEKAGWTSFDSTDFAETGGDRKAWQKKEAQRIANEKRAASKGGIIASQMGNAPAESGAMSHTESRKASPQAPKAALDYLKANPKALPDFIKKYGYDPTKQ